MLLIGHQFVKIEAMSCVCVSVQSWFEHVTYGGGFWLCFVQAHLPPPPSVIVKLELEYGFPVNIL